MSRTRNTTRFAIKVRFDVNDWLYVTDSKNPWDPKVVTYDTFDEAYEASKIWRLEGKEGYVRVVEYEEVDNAEV